MARLPWLKYEGPVWHVSSRGDKKKSIYRSDGDRRVFLDFLAEAARRYRWIVHAYVLMPKHFHLVIETPAPALSRGMQWLNGCYGRWFNKRRRPGRLFRGRFRRKLIENDARLMEILRYVVRNPARSGMVKQPDEHAWISYKAAAARSDSFLPSVWLGVHPQYPRCDLCRGSPLDRH